MADEIISSNEQYYDVSNYKDEIQAFIKSKRDDLDVSSNMEKQFNRLYKSVFLGGEESDVERFPHCADMFKTYKSAIIDSCLSGYSALVEVTGNDAPSMLKAPELKQTMIEQFKQMSLLEDLSGSPLDDWILKGETVSFIKLTTKKENYRIKQSVTDATTGEKLMSFTMKEGVSYDVLSIERIDPLDFFVDAFDYKKDPLGCTKIIRSWISPKELLSSDAYPLINKDEKIAIIQSVGKNGKGGWTNNFWSGFPYQRTQTTQTDKDAIEVLTFYGDFITSDNKQLHNIKAITIGNKIAYADYNPVSINRIIYAPYTVDRMTHRGISPMACATPINTLINRATDMFLQNLEDVSVPMLLYPKGSINQNQVKEAREKKQLEYNNLDNPPEFWAPPVAATAGLNLIQLVLDQNKNVLGLNGYLGGDTSGAVRTARESAIINQKTNARMRVETDVFSYRYLLNLFNTFYTFNRELALAVNNPLAPIYSDPELNISISTNASRADKEGELNRLMQMLQLPISQMIFSNLTPEQVVIAVRYLMAKAELTDADNLLELFDSQGNPQYPVDPNEMQSMGNQNGANPNGSPSQDTSGYPTDIYNNEEI